MMRRKAQEEEVKERRKERRGGRKEEEEGKGRRKERGGGRKEWRGGGARDLESGLYLFYLHGDNQEVTKRCCLSWLTNNSTIVVESKCGGSGVGELQGFSQGVQLYITQEPK